MTMPKISPIVAAKNEEGRIVACLKDGKSADERRSGLLRIPLFFFAKPAYRAARKYIWERGFLDGFRGLFISLSSGLVVFTTYAKLWERQQNEDCGGVVP